MDTVIVSFFLIATSSPPCVSDPNDRMGSPLAHHNRPELGGGVPVPVPVPWQMADGIPPPYSCETDHLGGALGRLLSDMTLRRA